MDSSSSSVQPTERISPIHFFLSDHLVGKASLPSLPGVGTMPFARTESVRSIQDSFGLHRANALSSLKPQSLSTAPSTISSTSTRPTKPSLGPQRLPMR